MNLTFQFTGKFILPPVSGKRRGYPRAKFWPRGKLAVYLYPHILPYNITESRGQVTNQALIL